MAGDSHTRPAHRQVGNMSNSSPRAAAGREHASSGETPIYLKVVPRPPASADLYQQAQRRQLDQIA